MSKFSWNDSQWPRNGYPKKFQTFKYEHIIYHFKVRDLEIIIFFERYLNFAKYEQNKFREIS